MVTPGKKYEASVKFPDGEAEIVEAIIRSGETPRDAIERVLNSGYEPGGRILEIKEHTPEFQIFSIGGDQG